VRINDDDDDDDDDDDECEKNVLLSVQCAVVGLREKVAII